jgi:hypothetical protein
MKVLNFNKLYRKNIFGYFDMLKMQEIFGKQLKLTNENWDKVIKTSIPVQNFLQLLSKDEFEQFQKTNQAQYLEYMRNYNSAFNAYLVEARLKPELCDSLWKTFWTNWEPKLEAYNNDYNSSVLGALTKSNGR